MKKITPLVLLCFSIGVFFYQFFLHGLLPIPSDTIVGLYYPYRDLYAATNPRGIPYKNFLLTDPVRQQIPWKTAIIEEERQFNFPLWNPFNGLGTPLLGNLQGGAFYPFNAFFFIFDFSFAWSLYILTAPFLGALFFYFYFQQLRLSKLSSFLGAFAFVFSGFFVAWFEWGNITHTILWIPFCLFAIEKFFSSKKKLLWVLLITLGLLCSFFAGYLQAWFYGALMVTMYFFFRLCFFGTKTTNIFFSLIIFTLFCLVASIQLIPTFQFIALSARNIDQSVNQPGWFIPWQNIIQFIIPDFFGNPATLNYWGVWNYAEFVGYIGIMPLFFSFCSIFSQRKKEVLFWIAIVLVALVFATPNAVSAVPFNLHIPFISTSQPTRLLLVIDLALVILATFGFDYVENNRNKKVWIPLLLLAIVFVSCWVAVFFNARIFHISLENILVTKRNLYFPTILFFIFCILFGIFYFVKNKQFKYVLIIFILGLAIFDSIRFATKFTPFTPSNYLFPQSPVLSFLQKNLGEYRMMTTDDRILPPNMNIVYHLATIDIYDPLYLLRYGEFIAALERKRPDIIPPFGFNRILTPHNTTSDLINFLGVKYILSLSDIQKKQFKKVFQQGQTRVYENTSVLPRAFFIKNIITTHTKQETIDSLFQYASNLNSVAIVSDNIPKVNFSLNDGNVLIQQYRDTTIVLESHNSHEGFLVLTDSYYPTWYAYIDGKKTKIYRTDYIARGIIIPAGDHTIEFRDNLP